MRALWSLVFVTAAVVGTGVGTGCESSKKHLLAAEESQVKLRTIQARAFDTTDKKAMLRAVMATLQDLGFVLDHGDYVLGTVTATKWKGYQLRMTVYVRERGTTQLQVRASAQYNLVAIEDPEEYQQFFDALSKSVFLAAQEVD